MLEKLSKSRYSPHLFDIAQDIVGALPLKLVERWLNSEQTNADAQAILANYQVEGYSVSSDSVGLTKLSQQKGLWEILALIDQPKRIIYGYGKAIAGESIGIWAADNTQMFYPKATDAATLISTLLTIQDEVERTCQIKIGLGAHYGNFYEICGGLYGLEADQIEDIAENRTHGGEILITQALCDRLPANHGFKLQLRHDLQLEQYQDVGRVYRVLDGARLDLQPCNQRYPIPYSEDFYADLRAYEGQLGNRDLSIDLVNEIAHRYTQNKVVVLIESKRDAIAIHEVSMFTQLSFSALMKDIGLRLLEQHSGTEVKVISSLGIYVFDQPAIALEFSQTFRHELSRQNIACRIGIAHGEVLIFDLAVGTRDIAGAPVNLASKMAQDQGKLGKIYVSAALKAQLKDQLDINNFQPVTCHISGMEIAAYEG